MPSPWHQHPTAYPDLFLHKREEQVVAARLYGRLFYSQVDDEVLLAPLRDDQGQPVVFADRDFDDNTHDGIHYHATMLGIGTYETLNWRVTMSSSGEWGNWNVVVYPSEQNWWEAHVLEEVSGDRHGLRRFLYASRVLSDRYPVQIWEGDLPTLDDASFDAIENLKGDATRYPGLFKDAESESWLVNSLVLSSQENWFMTCTIPSEMRIHDVWLVNVCYFHGLTQVGLRHSRFACLFDSPGKNWGRWSCYFRSEGGRSWFDWIHGDTDGMGRFLARYNGPVAWISDDG
ncbi:MAG: hypothetical protein AAF563_12335 [Pseudomonadota bacterium]